MEMLQNKHGNSENLNELQKYRDLVNATLDYFAQNNILRIKNDDFNSDEYISEIRLQAEKYFEKGKLAQLKQSFCDLTELQIQSADLRFNEYLKVNTIYDIDIFEPYLERVDKIVLREVIANDNEYYDIYLMVDYLSQAEPGDEKRIVQLQTLLTDYELRRSKKAS